MSIELIQIPSTELHQEPLGKCENLQQVVATMDTQVRKEGRVICAVFVNGNRLSEEDENQLASMGLNEIHSLEFETDDPQSLVRSTLDAQLSLMAEVERLGGAAAASFRALDIGRGQGYLISLLDACRWLTDALVALKGAQSFLDALAVDQKQWVAAEQKFHRLVADILFAVERQDYILLGDLLEYELANGLAGWRDLIAGVQKKDPQS